MDASFWLLVSLTLLAAIIAFVKSSSLPLQGLSSTLRLIQGVWIELVLGFVLAGLLDVLLPQPVLAAWLGSERLMRGILVGWGIGLIVPGGPYVLFPIVAGLFKNGAAAGPLICLLTAKTLVSPIRMLTYEAPLLGWPLTLARLIPGVLVPPVLGLIGHFLFIVFKSAPR